MSQQPKILVFNAVEGPMIFRLIYSAFVTRNPEKIAKDDRRYYAEIQTALESVSVPVGDLPSEAEIDMRNRKLDGPGSCELSPRALERLVTAVEESPFHPAISRQVEAVLDYLAAAPTRQRIETDLKVVGG